MPCLRRYLPAAALPTAARTARQIESEPFTPRLHEWTADAATVASANGISAQNRVGC